MNKTTTTTKTRSRNERRNEKRNKNVNEWMTQRKKIWKMKELKEKI